MRDFLRIYRHTQSRLRLGQHFFLAYINQGERGKLFYGNNEATPILIDQWLRKNGHADELPEAIPLQNHKVKSVEQCKRECQDRLDHINKILHLIGQNTPKIELLIREQYQDILGIDPTIDFASEGAERLPDMATMLSFFRIGFLQQVETHLSSKK